MNLETRATEFVARLTRSLFSRHSPADFHMIDGSLGRVGALILGPPHDDHLGGVWFLVKSRRRLECYVVQDRAETLKVFILQAPVFAGHPDLMHTRLASPEPVPMLNIGAYVASSIRTVLRDQYAEGVST